MTEFTVNSKIIITVSAEELSEQFAGILIEGLNRSRENFHLALSGGSSPRNIFKYIAEHYKSAIDWSRIRFFWGDERCVPPDNTESNYKMANDYLFSKIGIPQKNIFRISGENNPAEEAIIYSKKLLENIPLVNKVPEFDLIMLGLGEDGHTASIFPGSLNLFEEKNLCAVAEHPLTNQKRITITGSIINNAKQVVFLVTGKSKSEIAAEMLNKENKYENYPASYVNPNRGELIWLLDKDAASKLKR